MAGLTYRHCTYRPSVLWPYRHQSAIGPIVHQSYGRIDLPPLDLSSISPMALSPSVLWPDWPYRSSVLWPIAIRGLSPISPMVRLTYHLNATCVPVLQARSNVLVIHVIAQEVWMMHNTYPPVAHIKQVQQHAVKRTDCHKVSHREECSYN